MLVTTLDRYVLGEILRTLVLALVAIILIFALGTTVRLMRDELTYWQLLRSLPFAILFTLPYALPMSLLIAVTLTLGRLVADREVLALEACGVAPSALMAPALAVGVVLALVSSAFQATVLPYCHRRKVEIASAMLEELLELGEGDHWSKVFPRQGFDIYVRRHEGRRLSGIVIHRDAGEHPVTLTARRGTVTYGSAAGVLELELEDVVVTAFPRRSPPTTLAPGEPGWLRLGDPLRVRLARYMVDVPVMSGSLKLKPADLTSAQLRVAIEEERVRLAGAGGVPASRPAEPAPGSPGLDSSIAELASRATMATAPLIFVLLCVPLTFALRASNRLVPLVLGTFAASVFFLAPLLLGNTLSDRNGSSPFWPFLGLAGAAPATFGLARLARRRPR